jgi:hypothetical protein
MLKHATHSRFKASYSQSEDLTAAERDVIRRCREMRRAIADSQAFARECGRELVTFTHDDVGVIAGLLVALETSVKRGLLTDSTPTGTIQYEEAR